MDEKQKLEELMKSGRFTTEFWLALAAQVVGSAMAVGLVPGGIWEKVAGLALMVLASMGYTWSRRDVKLQGMETLLSMVSFPAPGEEEAAPADAEEPDA